MIYIVCRRGSMGAKELVAALNGIEGGCATRAKRLCPSGNSSDVFVGWGEGLPGGLRGRLLNPHRAGNKYHELSKLQTGGVPVPPFSRERRAGWLARVDNHQRAKDLLSGRTTGDYYVQYVPTHTEYRVHSFHGTSLRLAKKVPQEGKVPNPRFRAHNAGWKLSYGGYDPPRGLRDACHKACKALGYDFGAVDIGVKPDGGFVVFEVNSAPGLEGGTIQVYARAIHDFYRNKGGVGVNGR